MLLKTKRLTLREFNLADLDDLANLLGNKEVMRFSINGTLTREQTETFLKNVVFPNYSQGYGLLAVIRDQDKKFLGFAGLKPQTIDGKEELEYGYRLLPEFWGHGYATEAGIDLCKYAFHQLGMDYLISIIEPENLRSIKVAGRVGMHYWKETLFHGKRVNIYRIPKVVVDPYQTKWPEQFEKEKEKLKAVLPNVDLYHFGSTSIPGCYAKPIIDILGVASDVTAVDDFNAEMIRLGYEPIGEGGMKQRRFFRKRLQDPVNLHIFEDTDPETERHLRFCKYLKLHQEKITEYSDLKQKLAKEFSHDIGGYVLGKEKFVKQIDHLAAWELTSRIAKNQTTPRKSHWTSEQIKKALDVNLHLFVIYFAKFVPVNDLVFEPDVTVKRSDVPSVVHNRVLSARFNENNVDARITAILQHFRHRPISWIVSEFDTPSNLGEKLLEAGFVHSETLVGMALEMQPYPSPLQTELTFERVYSQERLRDFAFIEKEDPQFYDLFYSKIPPVLYGEDSYFEMYVGYKDKEPVAKGILLMHAGVAGIYNITIMPHHRKKGYATKLVNYLLQRARLKGFKIAILQTRPALTSVYEKSGFKECCRYQEYMEK